MKIVVAFGGIGIVLVILFVPWLQVFTFEETRTNTPKQYYLKVEDDKQFEIVFTHSIHLTDVIESYEIIDNDDIKLVSMQYSDVAIGMPSYAEKGQTLIYEDGLYTLKYDNKKLQEFNLYIGAVDYDLSFHYKGTRYNLKEELKKGHSYKFSVEHISVITYLKGESLNGET